MVDMRANVLPAALICFCSLTFAAENVARCPDPHLRQAEIGGDSIYGVLMREGKPVTEAVVKVYSSFSGKTAWVWTTDKDGKFTTDRLAPGSYRLEVGGSGGATVRLNPKLSHLGTGQVVNWNITLTEDGCISAGSSTN